MSLLRKAPVRVLIVDDSAMVRKILSIGLAKDPEIEVVGQASDPYRARDLLVELRPDVITLDVEMPKMDGVTFLKRFMPLMPTPTVIISSLTQAGKRMCLEALEAGAVDVVAKPVLGLVDGLPLMLDDICRRVKAAANADVSRFARRGATSPIEPVSSSLEETTDRVIAIGASTGGVEALARILPAFPADAPGVVIVQHMPMGFTASFAERLDRTCQMRAKEAESGRPSDAGPHSDRSRRRTSHDHRAFGRRIPHRAEGRRGGQLLAPERSMCCSIRLRRPSAETRRPRC